MVGLGCGTQCDFSCLTRPKLRNRNEHQREMFSQPVTAFAISDLAQNVVTSCLGKGHLIYFLNFEPSRKAPATRDKAYVGISCETTEVKNITYDTLAELV